jgi:hypothetical protein
MQTMEDIYIEATKQTPKIDFKCDGNLILEGRSLSENAKKIFDPLIIWARDLKSGNVIFSITLEYINSSSVKKIIELLKMLDSNDKIKKLVVKWNYEEGDDDNLETGQTLECLLENAEFQYFKYTETSNI